MSLVCWEMVPSIFTFSWEYTACRKENGGFQKKIPLETTLKEFPLRTHELVTYFIILVSLGYLVTCAHHQSYSNIPPWLISSQETIVFHQITNVLHFTPVYSPAGTRDQFSPSWACQSGPAHPADLGSSGKCGSFAGPSAAAVSLAVETPEQRYLNTDLN